MKGLKTFLTMGSFAFLIAVGVLVAIVDGTTKAQAGHGFACVMRALGEF